LKNKGLLPLIFKLPDFPRTEYKYELYKAEKLLDEVKAKIKVDLTASEQFETILNSSCPAKIVIRLREHVNSFKLKKNHRA
jgi:hypothetical protein